MTPGGRHQSFPFISVFSDSSFVHSAPASPWSTWPKATHFNGHHIIIDLANNVPAVGSLTGLCG
jgi:hypothetical protein